MFCVGSFINWFAIIFILKLEPPQVKELKDFVITEIKNSPFTSKLIAYNVFFSIFLSEFYLMRTTYKYKYQFYILLSSILNYFYLKSYPFSNVTLTKEVLICFLLYQATHNLFKFSFQLDHVMRQLDQGLLSTMLPL